MFGSKNPEKYDARALRYEQNGKTNKAIKNREKAAQLRASLAQPGATGGSGFSLFRRDPAKYEQNAIKWEQRNNFGKAQKNREKAWRIQHPQYRDPATHYAPSFYKGNTFQGYNLAPAAAPLNTYNSGFSGLNTMPLNSGLQSGLPLNSGLQRGLPLNSGLQSGLPLNSGLQSGLPLNSGLQSGFPLNSGLQSGLPLNSGLQSGLPLNSGLQSGFPLNSGLQSGLPLNTGLQVPLNSGLNNGFATTGFSSGMAHQTVMNAPITETHVRPTIVEQTMRPERIVEVQPIVHREIDAPQVRVIEKHIYETVASTGPSVITRGTIVEETVRPRIIEEVQPVVHREVPATFVERVEQHVTEHMVRPTVQTKEIVNNGGFVAAGGAPLAAPIGVAPATTTQQGGLAGKVNTLLHRNQQPTQF